MRNTRDPPDAYIMSPRYDRIIRHVRCHDKVATPLPLDSSIQTKQVPAFPQVTISLGRKLQATWLMLDCDTDALPIKHVKSRP